MEVISFSSKTRFGSDFLWNLASLGVLALSGIAVNILIGQWGGAHDLGVFNQVFAFFIFTSQLCVGGIHLSVLKELSHNTRAAITQSDISTTAILLVLAVATVIVACCLPFVGAVGRILQSPSVSFGLLLVMPGVIVFAVNKVLLNILNGLRCMKAHAIFQALRYLFLLGIISGMLYRGVEGKWLPLALTLAEVSLAILLIPFIHTRAVPFRIPDRGSVQLWFRVHLSFGSRGVLSGFLTELNTRIDILMLGFFHDDRMVSIVLRQLLLRVLVNFLLFSGGILIHCLADTSHKETEPPSRTP
jgi:O-antigen/teichoic acid export membrane protein